MTVEVVVEELQSLRDLLKMSPKMIKCLQVERKMFYFNEYGTDHTLYVTGVFSSSGFPNFIGVKNDKVVAMNQPGVPVVWVKRYDLIYGAAWNHLDTSRRLKLK